MRRFVLPRRTFLRGSLAVGTAAVGLPLLEAMLNDHGTALAGGAPLPMQFITWFIGNGYRLEQLEPSTTGAGFALSAELQPFQNVAEYLSIVTGLQNWCYAQPTHHEGMTAWNGYHPAQLSGLFSKAGGPTLDQLIADHIEATASPAPAIRSIQVGVSKRTSVMDSGTTMHVLSHRGTEEPLYPVFQPKAVFQTLFGNFVPQPDDKALRLQVIASVREDAKKLQAKVGAADRLRIEAHLDGLAELEETINTLPPQCPLPMEPTVENNVNVSNLSQPEPLDEVNKAMCDLIVAAFKCDVTRVASCMFIGGAAETVYHEIGQSEGFHNLTHMGSAQAQVHTGVVHAHTKLAYLLEQMKATVDATGANLLDTGLVLSGSDCATGYTHNVSRQPWILVGKLRDKMKAGYHHQVAGPYNGNEGAANAAGNTSDVLLTILKAFDPSATSIGDLTPRNRGGGRWWGTSNPPAQVVAGSTTHIPEITGPAFG